MDGSGDVAINPRENAQTLKLFQDGKLDGAWQPEPWAPSCHGFELVAPQAAITIQASEARGKWLQRIVGN